MDCSPPGPSVHRNLQARILEWVAVPFSRASSQLRERTQVFHTVGRQILYHLSHQACSLISCLPSASGGLIQQRADSTVSAAAPTVRPLAITPQTRTTNSSYTREETGDPRAKEPGEVHDCEDPEPESDPERAQPHKENLRAHFKVIQTAPTWVEGCPHPT